MKSFSIHSVKHDFFKRIFVGLILVAAAQTAGAQTNFPTDFDTAKTISPKDSINQSPIKRGTNRRKYADFDGDGKSDLSVFTPVNGNWTWLNSSTGEVSAVQWGASADRIVPADYDGDGKTDVAVWRPSTGTFYVRQSSDGAFFARQWGIITDKPRPADYDGDGKADLCVFRRAVQTGEPSVYWILRSRDNAVQNIAWGGSTDSSMPGDFDGDNIEDLTVLRNQSGQLFWYTRLSSNGSLKVQQWGGNVGHQPMTADFDGDGKTDVVTFTHLEPFNGIWWISGTMQGANAFQWGSAMDDEFMPADYDGDGKADAAVFRDNGFWYIRQSTDLSLRAVFFRTNLSDFPITRFPF